MLAMSPLGAQAAPLFAPIDASKFADSKGATNPRAKEIGLRKSTKSMKLVKLDLAALKGNAVEFDLAPGATTKSTTSRVDKRSEASYTWYGKLDGVAGEAIVVVGDGEAEGSIRDGQKLYRIHSVGNGAHAIVEVDESAFPKDEPESMRALDKSIPALKSATTGSSSAADSRSSSDTALIEVAVGYTASAETAKGGSVAMSNMIQLAIDETNQSYRNSLIRARVHLAGKFKVSYSESGKTYETILADFAGTGDGKMDTVHTLRNKWNADVAMLIINQTDWCGLADAILATPTTAFALVHYDCATGYYSFGHEMGHLFGARHNTEKDAASTPFAYGHGFHNGTSWRTIMSYDCTPSCPRLQYWSNPNVAYGGVAMGTVDLQDNARVLNTTASVLATFRNPDPSIWQYTGVPCGASGCSGWTALDNNPATVAIAAVSGGVYQLHNTGKIWKYTGVPCGASGCSGWNMVDNNANNIGIAADGTNLYKILNNGQIWRYNGSAWQMLDNNPRGKAIVASNGYLYQLHSTGAIWRFTGTVCSGGSCPGWTQLDGNANTKAIAADGANLYQIWKSGAIWRFTGTVCSGNSCPGWQLLDNNANSNDIAAGGGNLYQLQKTGTIWRYSAGAWSQLGNNPAAVAISAAGSNLYQLHANGALYKSTGVACSGGSCPGWQLLDNNAKTSAIDAAGSSLFQLHGN